MKKNVVALAQRNQHQPDARRKAGASALQTPTDIEAAGAQAIAKAINALLADSFALYMKTKNFHWHASGPHYRDYHLLLDEQADEILATIDPLAERVRKIGCSTLHSVSEIAKLQTLEDNNDAFVLPEAMITELAEDNQKMIRAMRKAHETCDKHDDVGTASLLENYIDAAEKRVWFLFEVSQNS